MAQPADESRVPFWQLPLLLFTLFTLLGLAGNFFRYEIFFDIHFIFGSIFALLALQFLGLGWGIAAGFASSLITYQLANHPYTIAILTTEVAVVGLLHIRRKIGLVLADAIYWMVIGIPMVMLLHSRILSLPYYIATADMMGQAINGITNALLARMLFLAIVSWRKKPGFSLRELIFTMLVLFVLLTSLLLLTMQSRSDLTRTEQSVRLSMSLDVQRTKPLIDDWLQTQLRDVAYLAWLVAEQPIPIVQRGLEKMRSENPAFLRIGLLDKTATIVAFTPLIDESGKSAIGQSRADRPFIPELKRTLKPMLSEVVLGRIGPLQPIVTALAPVVVRGSYDGFVAGIIDLNRMKEMITLNSKGASLPELQFVLLDQNDKIIVSSRPELKAMSPYLRIGSDLSDQAKGIFLGLPKGTNNSPVWDRWEKASYTTECRIGKGAPWRLILEQPMAPFQKLLYQRYGTQLVWIFTILLAALALAERLSRYIVRSLEELSEISRDIPARIGSAEEINWPLSPILETNALRINLQSMAEALVGQFKQIQRINRKLEQTVIERTNKFLESEERFRNMFEKVRVVALVIDPANGSIVDANPAATEFYGWTREQLIQKNIGEINNIPKHELRERLAMARRTKGVHIQLQHCRADGSVRDVEVFSGPIKTGNNTLLYSIIHDITDRNSTEAQVKQLIQEQQTILDTVATGLAYARGRKMVWTNPRFREIFGYPAEECANLDARRLYAHEEDYLQVGREGYPQMATGESFSSERLAIRKDGSTLWMEITGRAIDPAAPLDGSIWIFEDITSRKQTEVSLREKTQQLELLSRDLARQVEEEITIRMKNEQLLVQQSKLAAMGEMLGAIAHQWRQPLNTLGLCIQNIKEAYANDGLDKTYLDRTVEKSMNQIEHMSNTIDDFRNFFQPDKGLAKFDTMVAVGRVLALFSAQLKADNIVFRLTCHTHDKTFTNLDTLVTCPEKMITGYKNEFEHVILNLISNAKDAIMAKRQNSGSLKSEVGLITFDFSNHEGKVVIQVGDNGTGIGAPLLPRIFEPYYTTKEPAKGTGIGLYMSKVIIEDHMQGTLLAGNTSHGALFTITLPKDQ